MECLRTFIFRIPPKCRLSVTNVIRFSHSSVKPQSSNTSKYMPPMILASEKKITVFTNLLLNYGFSKGQVNHILNSPAGILNLNEKDLTANLLNWYSFETSNKLYTALTANAELLTLDPKYVNSRFTELMTLFTKTDINKLLNTCPKVFLDDFDVIRKK
ncbi:uncharacterized protein CEXT_31051 [Caerostris extrusa]|uniref:Mitochondrial transcription termination factor n=1 Tax=Caerostris extrusa TaxID=172846 RepID=A0AAV4WLV2_CAEEX|nr:uncharacterized protein CEXT_31051 [Caerostris extrusa]